MYLDSRKSNPVFDNLGYTADQSSPPHQRLPRFPTRRNDYTDDNTRRTSPQRDYERRNSNEMPTYYYGSRFWSSNSSFGISSISWSRGVPLYKLLSQYVNNYFCILTTIDFFATGSTLLCGCYLNIYIMLWILHRGNMFSIFSRNSEADAREILEYAEDMFPCPLLRVNTGSWRNGRVNKSPRYNTSIG